MEEMKYDMAGSAVVVGLLKSLALRKAKVNVIGVVGAAKGYFGFMIFGLVLSVVLTGALATYMANYIQKHIWIAYVGLILILIVGLQLIIGGLVDLEILKINEEFIKYF